MLWSFMARPVNRLPDGDDGLEVEWPFAVQAACLHDLLGKLLRSFPDHTLEKCTCWIDPTFFQSEKDVKP